MASTFSPSLRIELIGNGDQSGVWGQTTNSNLGTIIEQAITGVETISITDANYTLTNFNGISDQSRNAVLVISGTISQVRNVIAPLVEKTYTIKNSTTGGFGIQIIGSSGTGVTVPNGVTTTVYCDGTNFFSANTGTVDNFTVGGVLNGTTAVFSGAISSVSPAFTGTPTAPTATAGTNTTQIATTAFVVAALATLYPVGSIYTNAAVSTNPATLLGFGTWTAFGAGRVMVGLDASDALFDTAEETGGSKDAVVVSHTHTITDPGHKHAIGWEQFGDGGGTGRQYFMPFNSGGGFTDTNVNTSTTGISVDTAGVSGTNANVQPYITVYMWKRTA